MHHPFDERERTCSEREFSATGGAVVTGPAIADTATLSGNGKFATVTTVPPGTPGAASSVTTTTWKVLPGSWRQLLTGL